MVNYDHMLILYILWKNNLYRNEILQGDVVGRIESIYSNDILAIVTKW